MRVQRAIRVILSALLTVTLCFCMIGCQPSEEEVRRRELEQAKRTRIEEIDTQKEKCHTRLFATYCGKKTLYSESDYHTYCAFYAVCEKMCEEEKAEIEKIENIEDMPDFNIFREKIYNIPFYKILNSRVGFHDQRCSFLIKTETEDGTVYEIKSTYNMLSSWNDNYLIVNSADKELEVEYNVKLYFENGEEKEYRQADKSRVLYENDYSRLYNFQKNDCVEATIEIIVRKNYEVIGYTLLGGSSCMRGLKVMKSAAIKPECRSIVTSEKVAEYLKSENVDAEKRDGVKLRASEVEYRLGYYAPGPSEIIEITFRQGRDDAGKIYNEAIFYKYKKVDLMSYECWLDVGTIEVNGEPEESIILSEDKEDTIRWAAGSEDTGYLNIVGKEEGYNGYIWLLKTKKLDEEVYEGNWLMPEIYVNYGLGVGSHIFNEKEIEIIYSDNNFDTYIETLKKHEYRRPL